MENYIKNIEFINNHLLGRLSADEELEFSNRINSNKAFRLLFDEQKHIVNGIKSHAVRIDIQNAYEAYKRTKLIKNVFLTVFAIVLTIFTIYLLFNLPVGSGLEEGNTIFNTTDTIKTAKMKSVEFSDSLQVENLNIIKMDLDSLPLNTTPNPINLISNSNQLNEVGKKSNKEKVSIKDGISHMYQSWEEKPQVIFLEISKDTTVLCGKGTILGIKVNSLIIADTQQKVTGKIKIEVQEYYELPEMIFANLSTSSNTDLLETGGMIHLKITSEGKECILDKDKTIEVGFPKKRMGPQMDLFFGNKNDNSVNWKLMTSKSDTIINVSFSKVDSEITETKDIKIIEVSFGSKEDWSQIKKSDSLEKKRIIEILKKEDSTKNTNKSLTQISHYIFKSSRLGWLNCDRFARVGKPRIDYSVDLERIENIDVKIVFDDFNSILNGKILEDKFTFNNVPLGEKITIIAVKYEVNQYYLSILKTTVKKDAKIELIFEPLTMDNLKSKIRLVKNR